MSNLFSVGDVQKAFSTETTDEQFARLYNHTKPNNKYQIIVSCLSGGRSQIAAETLVKLGYKQLVIKIRFCHSFKLIVLF